MNIAFTLLQHGPASAVGTTRKARPAGWLARAGNSIHRALEASARARAVRHLHEFADRCEALQPDLAQELRAAALRDPEA
ncbi:MAG: hypothetical protein KGL99_01460 [Burkholderiales bacterium]|nr:hypothetical protein [Burkholderiales bacterium]